MGKIIKNDKVYSGTFDDATSVNYDNSVSGLNANSVQEGIDELADGLKNTSVVDNLLSTSTTLPLSANQGRVLDEKISALDDSLNYKASQVLNVGCNVQRIGNNITITSAGQYGFPDIPATTWTTIGTLNVDLRPKVVVNDIIYYEPTKTIGRIRVNTNGVVEMFSYSGVGQSPIFCLNYCV